MEVVIMEVSWSNHLFHSNLKNNPKNGHYMKSWHGFKYQLIPMRIANIVSDFELGFKISELYHMV